MNYKEMYMIMSRAAADTIELLVRDTIDNAEDTQIVMPQSVYDAVAILRSASLKAEQMYVENPEVGE